MYLKICLTFDSVIGDEFFAKKQFYVKKEFITQVDKEERVCNVSHVVYISNEDAHVCMYNNVYVTKWCTFVIRVSMRVTKTHRNNGVTFSR